MVTWEGVGSLVFPVCWFVDSLMQDHKIKELSTKLEVLREMIRVQTEPDHA